MGGSAREREEREMMSICSSVCTTGDIYSLLRREDFRNLCGDAEGILRS